MKTQNSLAIALCSALSAGCLGLSYGATTTTPTLAQELKELKTALAAGQITQEDYDAAKSVVLSRPAAERAGKTGISWANHNTTP